MAIEIESVEYEAVAVPADEMESNLAYRCLKERGKVFGWIEVADIQRRIRNFDWGPLVVFDSAGRKIVFTNPEATTVLLYRPVHPSDLEAIAQPLAPEALQVLSDKFLNKVFELARGNVSSPQDAYKLGKELGLGAKSHINQTVDHLCQEGMLKSDKYDQLKRYVSITFAGVVSIRKEKAKPSQRIAT